MRRNKQTYMGSKCVYICRYQLGLSHGSGKGMRDLRVHDCILHRRNFRYTHTKVNNFWRHFYKC